MILLQHVAYTFLSHAMKWLEKWQWSAPPFTEEIKVPDQIWTTIVYANKNSYVKYTNMDLRNGGHQHESPV